MFPILLVATQDMTLFFPGFEIVYFSNPFFTCEIDCSSILVIMDIF